MSGETITDLQQLGRSERRRSIYSLLILGALAASLSRYEEAIQHYLQCLRFLDERRMNDTNRRIRALLGLGWVHLETGSPTHALE